MAGIPIIVSPKIHKQIIIGKLLFILSIKIALLFTSIEPKLLVKLKNS